MILTHLIMFGFFQGASPSDSEAEPTVGSAPAIFRWRRTGRR